MFVGPRGDRCLEIRPARGGTGVCSASEQCSEVRPNDRTEPSIRCAQAAFAYKVPFARTLGLTGAVRAVTVGRTFFGAHSYRSCCRCPECCTASRHAEPTRIVPFFRIQREDLGRIIRDTPEGDVAGSGGILEERRSQHAKCSSSIARAHFVVRCARPLRVDTAAVYGVAPGRCCVPRNTNRLTDPIRKASAWHHEVMRTLGGSSLLQSAIARRSRAIALLPTPAKARPPRAPPSYPHAGCATPACSPRARSRAAASVPAPRRRGASCWTARRR